MSSYRIAMIGYGAMGEAVAAGLAAEGAAIGAVLRRSGGVSRASADTFTDVDALIAWRPQLVAECAGHEAVRDLVPRLLAAGIDCVVASVGALASDDVRGKLREASKGGGRLILPSGAIGGLDALRAARRAGLESVRYTGRKPPLAWAGTPAEQAVDLGAVSEVTTVFDGDAQEACALFPKNANVAASVALSGVGLNETRVTLVADPSAAANVHEITATGSFGSLKITLTNAPLPANPKTSWLAALSVQEAILQNLPPKDPGGGTLAY